VDRLDFYESVVTKFNGFLYRCACDDGFRMMEMTPGIEAMTGYPVGDFIGNRVRSFVSITHPEDVAKADAIVTAAVEAKSEWDMDYRLVGDRGQIVRVHEKGSAVYDAAGRPLYLEGVILNSTQVWEEREATIGWRSSLDAIMGHAEGITRILTGLKMLALNARIEAARAGAAGASFSVVANEMKQMAASAEEIVARIQHEKARIETKTVA
jgi:hypothetical protein